MAWVDPPKSWQFSWSVVSVLCHRTYWSLNNTPGFPLHPRPLLCPALTGSNETPTGGAGEQYGAEQEQSNKPGHKDLEKEICHTFREKTIVRNGWYFQILINVSCPNFLMAEIFLVLLQKAMFEPGQVQWTYLVICHLSILTEKRNAQLWNERNIMNGHWFGRSKQMFQVFCHYRAKVKIKSSKYIFIVPKVLDIRGLHSCLFASKRTNKNDGELFPVQWSQVNFLL